MRLRLFLDVPEFQGWGCDPLFFRRVLCRPGYCDMEMEMRFTDCFPEFKGWGSNPLFFLGPILLKDLVPQVKIPIVSPSVCAP